MYHNLKVTRLIVNEFVKKLDLFSKNGKLWELIVFIYYLFIIEILFFRWVWNN